MNDDRRPKEDPSVGMALGTWMGCLFAALFLSVAELRHGMTWLVPPIAALLLLPGFLVFAGPGAVILSLPLGWILHRLARRNGRKALLLHGALLGLPLGLVNLLVVGAILHTVFPVWTLEWMISAAGGGVGLGLGVAASIGVVKPAEGAP